jgi:hypothetical protein
LEDEDGPPSIDLPDPLKEAKILILILLVWPQAFFSPSIEIKISHERIYQLMIVPG